MKKNEKKQSFALFVNLSLDSFVDNLLENMLKQNISGDLL